YKDVFAELGLDPDDLPADPKPFSDHLSAHGRSQLEVGLASYLDDWSALLRERKDPRAKALSAFSKSLDVDARRNELRSQLQSINTVGAAGNLKSLATRIGPSTEPSPTLTLLASALREANEPQAAIDLLEEARIAHLDDAWIAQELGLAYRAVRPV